MATIIISSITILLCFAALFFWPTTGLERRVGTLGVFILGLTSLIGSIVALGRNYPGGVSVVLSLMTAIAFAAMKVIDLRGAPARKKGWLEFEQYIHQMKGKK